MFNLFSTPPLTRRRMWMAFGVAIGTDALQLALGPLGWTFIDEIFDVAAMVATCLLLGFHPLLLPTFLIELVPVVDMVPTWTGCVALVVALRKAGAKAPPMPAPASTGEPPPPREGSTRKGPGGDVIDV